MQRHANLRRGGGDGGFIRRHVGRGLYGAWRGRRGSRAALEHANDALAVAIDADDPFAMRRTQKVRQVAESVGPLVEAGLGLANRLLDVPEIQRPSSNDGVRQDAAKLTQTRQPRFR